MLRWIEFTSLISENKRYQGLCLHYRLAGIFPVCHWFATYVSLYTPFSIPKHILYPHINSSRAPGLWLKMLLHHSFPALKKNSANYSTIAHLKETIAPDKTSSVPGICNCPWCRCSTLDTHCRSWQWCEKLAMHVSLGRSALQHDMGWPVILYLSKPDAQVYCGTNEHCVNSRVCQHSPQCHIFPAIHLVHSSTFLHCTHWPLWGCLSWFRADSKHGFLSVGEKMKKIKDHPCSSVPFFGLLWEKSLGTEEALSVSARKRSFPFYCGL